MCLTGHQQQSWTEADYRYAGERRPVLFDAWEQPYSPQKVKQHGLHRFNKLRSFKPANVAEKIIFVPYDFAVHLSRLINVDWGIVIQLHVAHDEFKIQPIPIVCCALQNMLWRASMRQHLGTAINHTKTRNRRCHHSWMIPAMLLTKALFYWVCKLFQLRKNPGD